MSDTPRTDSQINGKGTLKLGGDPLKYAIVESEFARTLERELAAANRKIQRLVEIGDRLAMSADENPYNGSLVTQWNDERTAAKEEKAS